MKVSIDSVFRNSFSIIKKNLKFSTRIVLATLSSPLDQSIKRQKLFTFHFAVLSFTVNTRKVLSAKLRIWNHKNLIRIESRSKFIIRENFSSKYQKLNNIWYFKNGISRYGQLELNYCDFYDKIKISLPFNTKWSNVAKIWPWNVRNILTKWQKVVQNCENMKYKKGI